MTDQTPADQMADAIKEAIDSAVARAVSPLVWELRDLVGTLEDVSDRLLEEQRRNDVLRAEMAREARKANGPQS